jgi:hypothetical protein
MRFGVLAVGSVSLLAVAATPTAAFAHFYIDYPGSDLYPGPSPVPWWHEDQAGSPQKLGPCGDEDDATDAGGGPTGVVTPFRAGQTVTLQWTEVVSHTGWFRIALASDRSQFVDPPVQVDSNGNSADAGIENPPVLPVLADGVYPHAIGGSMTWPPYSLTLPNTPCAKCTIQIIQVMLDHPSNLTNLPDGAPNPDGFLYHHCIDISISAPDGGQESGPGDSGADSTVGDSAVSTGPVDSGADSTVGDSAVSTGPVDSGADSTAGDSGVGPFADSGADSAAGNGSGADSGAAPEGDASVAATEAPLPGSSGCGCTLASPGPTWASAIALLGLVPLLRRRTGRRTTPRGQGAAANPRRGLGDGRPPTASGRRRDERGSP